MCTCHGADLWVQGGMSLSIHGLDMREQRFCSLISALYSAEMRAVMDQHPSRLAAFIHRIMELRKTLPVMISEFDIDDPAWQPQPGYMDDFESDGHIDPVDESDSSELVEVPLDQS